jgi:hypothetical protein
LRTRKFNTIWVMLVTYYSRDISYDRHFKYFNTIEAAEDYRSRETDFQILAHLYFDNDRMYFRNQKDLDNKDSNKSVDNMQILKVNKM